MQMMVETENIVLIVLFGIITFAVLLTGILVYSICGREPASHQPRSWTTLISILVLTLIQTSAMQDQQRRNDLEQQNQDGKRKTAKIKGNSSSGTMRDESTSTSRQWQQRKRSWKNCTKNNHEPQRTHNSDSFVPPASINNNKNSQEDNLLFSTSPYTEGGGGHFETQTCLGEREEENAERDGPRRTKSQRQEDDDALQRIIISDKEVAVQTDKQQIPKTAAVATTKAAAKQKTVLQLQSDQSTIECRQINADPDDLEEDQVPNASLSSASYSASNSSITSSKSSSSSQKDNNFQATITLV